MDEQVFTQAVWSSAAECEEFRGLAHEKISVEVWER